MTEEARNAKNFLMEDSRESERKLEEKFRAELSAQTRLANLYKYLFISQNSSYLDRQLQHMARVRFRSEQGRSN